MHRLMAKFKNFFKKQVRPSLCADCKVKMDKKFGLSHKIKHKIHRRKGHKKHSGHKKLSAGIHHVKIGKKMRKVKVLANGRWRFMKG